MTDNVKNILFISLSCVGDAVMTTPVIESLHQSFPDARFDIVGMLEDSRPLAAPDWVVESHSRGHHSNLQATIPLRHVPRKRHDTKIVGLLRTGRVPF